MKSALKGSALAAAIVFGVGAAHAAPILSGDGTETCILGAPLGGGACTVTTIGAHPAWSTAANGQWISYADTGYGGKTLAPFAGTTPLFTVFEQISVAAPSWLSLSVWADDTAGVFLNGRQMTPAVGLAPNFIQDVCAQGSLGCQPGEAGFFSATLAPGAYTLALEVYQVGTGLTTSGNPFGLLFEGAVDTVADGPGAAAVPVPASAFLLAAAMAGVGFLNRRRRC